MTAERRVNLANDSVDIGLAGGVHFQALSDLEQPEA